MSAEITPGSHIRQIPIPPRTKTTTEPSPQHAALSDFEAYIALPIAELAAAFEAFPEEKKAVFRILAQHLSDELNLHAQLDGDPGSIAKTISTSVTEALTLILHTSLARNLPSHPAPANPKMLKVFDQIQLNQSDEIATMAKILENAHSPFPLLTLLMHLKTAQAPNSLLQELTQAAKKHFLDCHKQLAQHKSLSPWAGRLATFKILGHLDQFPTPILYEEGSKLCRTYLAQVPENHSISQFLRDLLIAYENQNLSEIKKVMAKLKE